MDIKGHFIVGLVLFVILYPFLGISSIFVLLISIFLDIDHYLLFVAKTGKFSIKEAVNYHEKERCGRHNLCIFHTIEFLIFLAIISFFSKTALILFIGAVVHLFIDYFEWFVWFSYYSERIPSIILAPIVFRKGKRIDNKIKRLGGRCIVCGFDKAWDIHHILKGRMDKEVMLCPNHHYMLHKGCISDGDLLKILDENKPK